ncbi:hypothetical protein TSUD_59720, partial [Trifolium subterraneum]
MGINCPSTALAKRWGNIYKAPLICKRYVTSSIKNLHFTSTDLSVGVSAGTQAPSGYYWTARNHEQPCTTVWSTLIKVKISGDVCGNLKFPPSFPGTKPKLTTKNPFIDQMAGANNEFVGENNHPNPPNHQNQFDGQEASVTPEGSAAHAQVTPLDIPPPHQPPQPEDPLVVPQVPQGAPMEVVMAALVNTINRQGQILREQADNMRYREVLVDKDCRHLRIIAHDRGLGPRGLHLDEMRRDQRSPPRRNNRSPPRNGEAAARGGNARHSPRRESPGSGDERHRGPLSRRIMDIPLPRGLEKPPTLDKYDGTTDPDEHVQSELTSKLNR